MPELALSIRQPFAWLIATRQKNVENRGWPTPHRGRFFLHAAKTYSRAQREEAQWLREHFELDIPERLEVGGIVGEATLVDCVTQFDSVWFSGPYGFVLEQARPLPFRPLRGKLGFFTID